MDNRAQKVYCCAILVTAAAVSAVAVSDDDDAVVVAVSKGDDAKVEVTSTSLQQYHNKVALEKRLEIIHWRR